MEQNGVFICFEGNFRESVISAVRHLNGLREDRREFLLPAQLPTLQSREV